MSFLWFDSFKFFLGKPVRRTTQFHNYTFFPHLPETIHFLTLDIFLRFKKEDDKSINTPLHAITKSSNETEHYYRARSGTQLQYELWFWNVEKAHYQMEMAFAYTEATHIYTLGTHIWNTVLHNWIRSTLLCCTFWKYHYCLKTVVTSSQMMLALSATQCC